MDLESRLRRHYENGELDFPFPAGGQTAVRHRKLAELARVDLPLARLAEAHIDAIAILAEAGRQPHPGLYGVWAAESADSPIRLVTSSHGQVLTGKKMFCSGAGIVDRALVTAGSPEPLLVDVSLRDDSHSVVFDQSVWKNSAFAETQTATACFSDTPIFAEDIIGARKWYLDRPGFWHGACGPAACWAGGAIGLYDYALSQSRNDSHTMAHLGGIRADVWALWAYLECAGDEIDSDRLNETSAKVRALTVRHLVEQSCANILTRVGRAYGPRALALDEFVSKRYQEVDLYIRQCHAEKDLEVLGRECAKFHRKNGGGQHI